MYDILFVGSDDILSKFIIQQLENSMLRVGVLSSVGNIYTTALPVDNTYPFIPPSKLILSIIKNQSINESLILECLESKTIFIGIHKLECASKYSDEIAEKNAWVLVDCNLERILLDVVMKQIIRFCEDPIVFYRIERCGFLMRLFNKIHRLVSRIAGMECDGGWLFRMTVEIKGLMNNSVTKKKIKIESEREMESVFAVVITQFVYFMLERRCMEDKKSILYPEDVLGEGRFIEMLRSEKIKIDLVI